MLRKSVVKLVRKMVSNEVIRIYDLDANIEDVAFEIIDEGKHGIHIEGTISVHEYQKKQLPTEDVLIYLPPLTQLHPDLMRLSKPPHIFIPNLPITVDLHVVSKSLDVYAQALNVEEVNLLDTIYEMVSSNRTPNSQV